MDTMTEKSGRSPAIEWSGPGPLLPVGLRASVAAALSELGAVLTRDFSPPQDFACAKMTLARAIAAAESVLTATASPGDREVALALQAARRVQHQLDHLEIERHRDALSRLNSALVRLDGYTTSVTELLSAVPELVCRLGFDRALISRVKNRIWYPELMFILGGGSEWAEQITSAGNARPGAIRAGIPEAELVDDQRSILVTGVRDSPYPRSGPQAMIKASGTRSYVAAPIVSSGQVVGMLHADCYGSRREVDEVDRELLDAFAAGLRSALARSALHEQLIAARSQLRKLTADLLESPGAPGGVALFQPLRPPGSDTSTDLLIRRDTTGGGSDRLPSVLTDRELQVLRLMSAGCTNTAIAEQLLIAEGTVKKHVLHILRKLQVANRSEAVARWFRSGGDSGRTSLSKRD